MWLDIVLVAILIVFTVIGLFKGFIDSVLGLISTGVAFVIAIVCTKPATKLINKIVDVPKWFNGMLDKVASDETIKIFGAIEFSKIEVANFLSVVFSILVVFILVKVAIWLLARLFSSAVEKSTFGSGLNKTLGGLFGALQGAVVVIVILVLMSLVSGTRLFGDKIQTTIDDSKVTHTVYKYVSDYTEKAVEKADIQDFVKDLVKNNQGEQPATPAK